MFSFLIGIGVLALAVVLCCLGVHRLEVLPKTRLVCQGWKLVAECEVDSPEKS